MELPPKFIAQRDVILALKPGWHCDNPGADVPPPERVQLACDIASAMMAHGISGCGLYPVGEHGGVDLCWDNRDIPEKADKWCRYACLTLQNARNADCENDGTGDTDVDFTWWTPKSIKMAEIRLLAQETRSGDLENVAERLTTWMFAQIHMCG